MQAPLLDAGGVDIESASIETGGNAYTWAVAAGKGGLRYEPQTGSLVVYRNLLEPAPPSLASAQKVELTVRELTDYAGNKMAAPFSWSFTVDRPDVSGEPSFKQLTASGGSSPAISSDAVQVAFVSARSGAEKVWVMRSDDYEEKAGSAKPLTGAGSAGREAVVSGSDRYRRRLEPPDPRLDMARCSGVVGHRLPPAHRARLASLR